MAEAEGAGGQPGNQPAPEISGTGRVVMYVGLALVLLGTIAVAAFAPDPNVTPESAAGVLALVTAAAVAIERILEGLWTLVGLRTPWWPMSRMVQAVNTFADYPNEQLEDVFNNVDGFVQQLRDDGKLADDKVEDIRADITNLRTTTLRNLQTLVRNAPDIGRRNGHFRHARRKGQVTFETKS
jgi:hypothetical protein